MQGDIPLGSIDNLFHQLLAQSTTAGLSVYGNIDQQMLGYISVHMGIVNNNGSYNLFLFMCYKNKTTLSGIIPVGIADTLHNVRLLVSVFIQMLNQKVCRSEEHTSELQSRFDLVCRLLLEKKKT